MDVSGNGPSVGFNGFPHDWTEGTGVFPASGVITLPNPQLLGMKRVWLMVQSQDVGSVTIKMSSTLADGVTASTATIVLAPAASSGAAGESYENYHQLPSLVGVIIITGTAGQKVAVLERLK